MPTYTTDTSTMPPEFPGMEFAFLRYMEVQSETQRRLQSFYLPFFQGCHQVVDLACGDADFVALLQEQGIGVTGVDSDEKAFASAQARQLPVVRRDVFAYLHEQPDESVDGIFSAHLIEHLPYPKVIELIQQSQRILRPGGRIVLATPNVRSLFSHLEMFYLHYGHVTFYHPRLICFFLDQAGFGQTEFGENPATGSPLLPAVQTLLQQRQQTPAPVVGATLPLHLHYRAEIPPQGTSWPRQASYRVKRWLTNLLVRPLTDHLARQVEQVVNQGLAQVNQRLAQVNQALLTQQAELEAVAGAVQSLNGAFETYATAVKAGKVV